MGTEGDGTPCLLGADGGKCSKSFRRVMRASLPSYRRKGRRDLVRNALAKILKLSHFFKASWCSVRFDPCNGGGENENRRLDGKMLFERLPECYASAQLRTSVNSFQPRAEDVLPSQVCRNHLREQQSVLLPMTAGRDPALLRPAHASYHSSESSHSRNVNTYCQSPVVGLAATHPDPL
jgi:hypothetical protein